MSGPLHKTENTTKRLSNLTAKAGRLKEKATALSTKMSERRAADTAAGKKVGNYGGMSKRIGSLSKRSSRIEGKITKLSTPAT